MLFKCAIKITQSFRTAYDFLLVFITDLNEMI